MSGESVDEVDGCDCVGALPLTEAVGAVYIESALTTGVANNRNQIQILRHTERCDWTIL